jgi:hypothetical protein
VASDYYSSDYPGEIDMPDANMHRNLAEYPLGYFITMRTYGTWLHGDARGSTDRKHNVYGTAHLAADERREYIMGAQMGGGPYLLAKESALLVEQTIAEVCSHRGWQLFVVRARTNHVHSVVHACVAPERILNDFKSWGTRKLRQAGYAASMQTIWADHGSTPYLWTDAQLNGAIEYVKDWQGGPLQKTWDQVREVLDHNDNAHKESKR